jgi:peroxiredoxin
MSVVFKKLTLTLSLFLLFSIICVANDTLRVIKSSVSIQLQNLQQKKIKISLVREQEYYLFIFLSPECPLCQNYSKDLNKLFAQYKYRIAFYGIIPGKAYSSAQVKKFSESYRVKFDLLFDKSFQLVRLLHATTTPEVYLVNKKKEIVYSGKIDNWALSLGVKRAVVTYHYLDDAIFSSLNNKPVKMKFTHPVGCLINSY